jgi:thiamine-monophosphate kinase
MGEGREFDRIRRILATLGDIAEGAGDDVAVIPEGDGNLVTSVDSTVAGVHFRTDWLSAEEVGWRATAAALSDLAASGAAPVGMLLAWTIPAATSDLELEAMARGVGALARAAHAPVLGGNLTGGELLSLTITVFGRTRRLVTRRGARVGEAIYVTGTFGGARVALTSWQQGSTPSPAARVAFARPYPRLAAGQWLVARGATAMIDVSDGLGGDAGHLAAASGVGLEIDLARVPVHPAVHGRGVRGELAASVFAALGGEDYELLLTAPEGAIDPAHAEPAAGVSLTRIGTVVAGGGARFLLDGRPVALEGFVHG